MTAWGQARNDRAKEQAYLRQLVSDLHETERDMAFSDSPENLASGAIARVHYAYYQPQPPTADSHLFQPEATAEVRRMARGASLYSHLWA